MPTNRDGVRYGAERDLYAIRCGPGRRACLRIGTACVLRIGTTSDTVRARTASERSGRRSICGAATIGACERCGSEPRASVTERAVRALLDEFTASALSLRNRPKRRSPSRRRTTPTLNGGPLLDDLSYFRWVVAGFVIVEAIYMKLYMKLYICML